MSLEERASTLVGFPIATGTVLVMLCATGGGDHHGEEHELPAGALAIVGDIRVISGDQGLGIDLTIPVDPAADYAEDDTVMIVNTFDEGDTVNRFAFRIATDEERAKLHQSWWKKIYSVDVKICATAYIRATSPAEALQLAHGLKLRSLELKPDEDQEVPISGRQYQDPDLPDISLSPAMTLHGPFSDGTQPYAVD